MSDVSQLSIARTHMTNGQLRVGGGLQRASVLHAMGAVPRENFFDAACASLVYAETTLRYADGIRPTGTPYALGRLIDAAAIEPHHNVLIIGGYSGYSAAVVHCITPHVSTTEREAVLCQHAQQVLAGTVRVQQVANLTGGLPDYAPYDVIIIEGCVEQIPAALMAQLTPTGSLTTVLLQNNTPKLVSVYANAQHHVVPHVHGDLTLPALNDFNLPQGFSFA